MSRSPITTHILDTSRGGAAAGIPVTLEFQTDAGSQSWQTLSSSSTNSDGRIEDLLNPEEPLKMGTYRLRFQTLDYFRKNGAKTFYPQISISFQIEKPDEHYHVPLLLSPFGYSTYRGT